MYLCVGLNKHNGALSATYLPAPGMLVQRENRLDHIEKESKARYVFRDVFKIKAEASESGDARDEI